ncbi:cation transporter [Thermomonas brevis]
MSDCGCHDTAATLSKNTDHARRRVLWVVLAINVLLFVGEFSAGWWADSSALQADSLDSLGDALVYILSLWVIGGTLRQRTKAVFLKGGIQALFGLAVLVEGWASRMVGGRARRADHGDRREHRACGQFDLLRVADALSQRRHEHALGLAMLAQ